MSPPEKINAGQKVGAYCLANDEALEWFQAFVRSFRKYNPTLPLTVIPYNADISRLEKLQGQFQFSLMDETTYARFDSVAYRVAGQHIAGGTFRKLTCFLGEYDTFIFLDSDIVVTMCFDDLIEAYQNTSYDLVYFDTDLLVFKLPFARKMMAEYNTFGFNSGAFLSRKTAVSDEDIMAAVASGEKVRDDFAIWGEQPFFNYLFQTLRRRLTHVNTLSPELTFKPKALMPFAYDMTSGYFLDPEQGRLPFIHWAGHEYPVMIKKEIFLKFRTLGMNSSERNRYLRGFFYRRLRAKTKQFLLNTGVLAKWVNKRDLWIKEKSKKINSAVQA
jgi:hypothetical protein